MVNGGVYNLDIGITDADILGILNDGEEYILNEVQLSKFLYALRCSKAVNFVVHDNGIPYIYPASVSGNTTQIGIVVYFWNANDRFSTGFSVDVEHGLFVLDHDS